MVSPIAAVVAVSALGVPESVTLNTRSLNVPAQDAVSVPPNEAPEADCVMVRQLGSVPLTRVHA